jgi:hypothetical protein
MLSEVFPASGLEFGSCTAGTHKNSALVAGYGSDFADPDTGNLAWHPSSASRRE